LLRFGFWNLNQRPLTDLVGQFAREREIDVLALAECRIPAVDLLSVLNSGSTAPTYVIVAGNPSRVLLVTRLPSQLVVPCGDLNGLALRHVLSPVGPSILLGVVHLASKLYLHSEDQTHAAVFTARDIEKTEEQLGHTRTLVLGDFNMNPFESGVVGAGAFHAISARSVALRGQRTTGGVSRPFYYNPSWRALSYSHGLLGTYYYEHSGPLSYYWNAFDQALLRPSLLPLFDDEQFNVVTQIGGTSLLSPTGIPDRTRASDHLPITVALRDTV
jgi:hypothetical protein